MKRKIIMRTLVVSLFLLFLLPTISFAETSGGLTLTQDQMNQIYDDSGMSPNGRPIGYYSWDAKSSFLGSLDILNSIASFIFYLEATVTNGIMHFFNFCLNPTPILMSDTGVTLMSYIFNMALIFKAVIFSFLPFILAVTIVIDFTKGDYRMMLNRFAQVFIAVIGLYVYNNFFSDPSQMRSIVDLTQDGAYLILGATTGAVSADSDMTLSDANAQQWENAFSNNTGNISKEVFDENIEYTWELGETGHTNTAIGRSYELKSSGFGISPTGNKTQDVKDTINNDGKMFPEYPDTISDDTLWRKVILNYPSGSKVRTNLVKHMNEDDVFDFSGGERLGIAFSVFISTIIISVFYIMVSIFLLLTFLMIYLGVPLGSFAIVACLVPTKGSIRAIKGWLGFMGGALIAKYLVVFVVGIVVGSVEKFRVGVDFTDPANTDKFQLSQLFTMDLVYLFFLILLYTFRQKINPLTFINMAVQSGFNGLRGVKMRSRDPLFQLENAYRMKYRQLQKNTEWGDMDDLRKHGAKVGKPVAKAMKKGLLGLGGKIGELRRLPNEELEKNKKKNQAGNPQDANTPPSMKKNEVTLAKKNSLEKKEKALEGELVDKEQKLLGAKQEQRKLLALPNGKLATITYKNKERAEFFRRFGYNIKVTRNSKIAKGKYSAETWTSPEGQKFMRIKRKDATTTDKASQTTKTGEVTKPTTLPSEKLMKNGAKINRNAPSLKKDGKESSAPKLDADAEKQGDKKNIKLLNGNVPKLLGSPDSAEEGKGKKNIPTLKADEANSKVDADAKVNLNKTEKDNSVPSLKEVADKPPMKERVDESFPPKHDEHGNVLLQKGQKDVPLMSEQEFKEKLGKAQTEEERKKLTEAFANSVVAHNTNPNVDFFRKPDGTVLMTQKPPETGENNAPSLNQQQKMEPVVVGESLQQKVTADSRQAQVNIPQLGNQAIDNPQSQRITTGANVSLQEASSTVKQDIKADNQPLSQVGNRPMESTHNHDIVGTSKVDTQPIAGQNNVSLRQASSAVNQEEATNPDVIKKNGWADFQMNDFQKASESGQLPKEHQDAIMKQTASLQGVNTTEEPRLTVNQPLPSSQLSQQDRPLDKAQLPQMEGTRTVPTQNQPLEMAGTKVEPQVTRNQPISQAQSILPNQVNVQETPITKAEAQRINEAIGQQAMPNKQEMTGTKVEPQVTMNKPIPQQAPPISSNQPIRQEAPISGVEPQRVNVQQPMPSQQQEVIKAGANLEPRVAVNKPIPQAQPTQTVQPNAQETPIAKAEPQRVNGQQSLPNLQQETVRTNVEPRVTDNKPIPQAQPIQAIQANQPNKQETPIAKAEPQRVNVQQPMPSQHQEMARSNVEPQVVVNKPIPQATPLQGSQPNRQEVPIIGSNQPQMAVQPTLPQHQEMARSNVEPQVTVNRPIPQATPLQGSQPNRQEVPIIGSNQPQMAVQPTLPQHQEMARSNVEPQVTVNRPIPQATFVPPTPMRANRQESPIVRAEQPQASVERVASNQQEAPVARSERQSGNSYATPIQQEVYNQQPVQVEKGITYVTNTSNNNMNNEGNLNKEIDKGAFNVEKPTNINFFAQSGWENWSNNQANVEPINQQEQQKYNEVRVEPIYQEQHQTYHQERPVMGATYQEQPRYDVPPVEPQYQETQYQEQPRIEQPQHQEQPRHSEPRVEPIYQEQQTYHQEPIVETVYQEQVASNNSQSQQPVNQPIAQENLVEEAPIQLNDTQFVQKPSNHQNDSNYDYSHSTDVINDQMVYDLEHQVNQMAEQIQKLGNKVGSVANQNFVLSSGTPQEIVIEDIFDNSYLDNPHLSKELKEHIENNLKDLQYLSAINFAVANGRISQNMLRKAFNVDANVAKGLIQEMEKNKDIGPREGTKGHQVLKGKTFDQIRSERQAEEQKEQQPTAKVKAPKLPTSRATEITPIQLTVDK